MSNKTKGIRKPKTPRARAVAVFTISVEEVDPVEFEATISRVKPAPKVLYTIGQPNAASALRELLYYAASQGVMP